MRSISTRLAQCLIAALAVAALGPVSAQPPATPGLQTYEVELVIFRISGGNTTEQLAVDGAGPALSLGVEDGEPTPSAGEVAAPIQVAPAGFPVLPAAKFKLTPLEETLRRSRNYQPIAHIGWTQPGYPRNAAQFLPLDALVDPASGLKGQVALSRGRYLHLTLDLAFEPVVSAGDTSQRVVMRTTRRMRSNERHYIDHPRLGVIAIVTPVTG
jgi:hypothetical protein